MTKRKRRGNQRIENYLRRGEDLRCKLFGGEYWIGNILALRAGYSSKMSWNRLGRFNLGEGVTVGFGLNLKIAKLDCAYVPYGDLGDTYRVSLLTRFGGEKITKRDY